MNSPAKRHVFISCLAVALMIGLFVSGLAMALEGIPVSRETQKPVEPLPVIGDMDNFRQLLSEYITLENDRGYYVRAGRSDMVEVEESSNIVMLQKSISPASPMADADTSATNVQVQGVDEADIVKTDGTYIYQVNERNVVIIKAVPADAIQVAAKINFDKAGFVPQEIFLDNKHLVVIGHHSPEMTIMPTEDKAARVQIYPLPRYYQSTTLALIYNIEDKNHIQKVREIELQGEYLSARKIDSALYLVSRSHINYRLQENEDIELPYIRDSVSDSDFRAIDCADISYFPGEIYPAYIIAAGLDLNKNEKVNVTTCLGNGENIYASLNRLYIAVTRENAVGPILRDSNFTTSAPAAESQTSIYSFGLANGQINYQGKGQVPGRILNQFSMDENAGYFRIATTSGEMWRDDAFTSKNNLYVLDPALQITGRLEGIAPGEQIYSTRFMGNRAYMVTFRTVDPLFVIDLSNPSQPSILGKLKIPGYSDYLHPYDENHLIGFGKDTIELKTGGNEAQAFYQGIKIALFDVSDVNNPRQIAQEIIGDRGTDSELLHNHKALLFSREKNLLAFPVTLMTVSEEQKLKSKTAYGSFAYQGAYIYNIDPKNGFRLQGRITHISEEDYQKAGDAWYMSEKNVQRIIYINNTLYTLSPNLIKAHQISNLQEISSIPLR